MSAHALDRRVKTALDETRLLVLWLVHPLLLRAWHGT